MTAEDRTEQSVLHPADIQLLELRVLWSGARATGVIGVAEETADVSIEVGIARQREAQTCRHLFAQHVPRRIDVAAPHVRTIVLLTSEGRARHDEDTLGLSRSLQRKGSFTLRLIDTTHSLQGECVTQ